MNDVPLHLFEAVGIELEYMLVDAGTLSVLPAADRILAAAAGRIVSELELGPIAWSNELVLHVIELKTNGPARRLRGLGTEFQNHIRRINALLQPLGGRLMPSACHPWMNPAAETVLWPHEYSPVYEAYDRIFGCRGHGWANLQSMHINLPFHGDEEFARLHAAIRFLLPIMPALAAASPVLDGRWTGFLDARMEVYRHNSERIPSIAGKIVPEPVYSQTAYEREIFGRMYADIAPYDPAGTLQHPFLNSRGAIARFERGAIEIRVLDVQEHPGADLTVAALICAALEALCREQWAPLETIQQMDTRRLVDSFLEVIREADQARIADSDYLRALGVKGTSRRAGEIWRHLAENCLDAGGLEAVQIAALNVLMEKGCLARRIMGALNGDMRRAKLAETYARLCDCLEDGRMFF